MNREDYIVSINGGAKERVDLEHLMGIVHNYADEHIDEDSGLTIIKVWHVDSDEDGAELPPIEALTQFEHLECTTAEMTKDDGVSLNYELLSALGYHGWERIPFPGKYLFKRPIRGRPPDKQEAEPLATKSNSELRADVMELADDIQADVDHGECFYESDMLNGFCETLDKLKRTAIAYHNSNKETE